VSVSFCTLPKEQSNVGVAENVNVFNVPGDNLSAMFPRYRNR